MRASRPESERGFSLIELMVAMLITLIVTGAIYALLASGQNAFRREPEVSDRQQNIRLAMDLIVKDITNAGSNLPSFAQVFTRTDPTNAFLNGMGPIGSIGAPGQALRGGDATANSDVLELVAVEDRYPAQSVCTVAPLPGAAGSFGTREFNPTSISIDNFTIQTDNANMTIQPTIDTVVTPCPGGNANPGGVTLGAAVQVGTNPVAPPFTPPGTARAFLYSGRVARYMIAPNPFDPLDPLTPNLWRSVTGRYNRLGGLSAAPGDANSAWRMVARGIEDLQVEYRDGTNAWTNDAPAATFPSVCGAPDGCQVAGAFTPLVREVRVTLSARTTAPLLQGAVAAGGVGPNAIRGQLLSVVQPRATLWALQMGGQIR